MNEYRFDGRVAIVTGAGRGIGRAHALLLAAHGASVVVNDLGGTIEGSGTDAQPARAVADEIVAAGGSALPDDSDVATVAGGQAVVDAAIEQFGRVDIVVNNAGIIRWGTFPEADADNLEQHLAVHLGGSFNTTRAAWPHMVEQDYGRVLMTASTGMFGLPNNLSYAAAKAGVVGLTRSLALAGAPHGIMVNAVAPAAHTRMAVDPGDPNPFDPGPPEMSPDLVAPVVAFLAHEDCPVTGQIFAAGAGRVSRIFIASTPGYLHPGLDLTIDDVARNWATINDETGYYVPADLAGWSAHFMAHLDSRADQFLWTRRSG